MVSVEPIDRPRSPGLLLAGRRILVVDDEVPVQRSLTRVLLAEGAEVVTAGTLLEAFRLVEVGPHFDAAVVDYWLVDAKGPDLIARMRSMARPCCALLITGTRSPEVGQEAIASGAEDFLLKPFTVLDFLDAVERTVERTLAWHSRLSAPMGQAPCVAEVLDASATRQASRARPTLPVRLMSVQDLLGYVATMGEAFELSERQVLILHRLMAGDAVEAIAQDLGVTARTVKYHACRIYEKVGVHSRVELQSVLFDRFGGR